MEGDERGFRVALVTDELLNPRPGRLDALAVLEEEGWGVIQLPASDHPDEVAARLLDLVAEQTEEFAHHGYRLVVVGRYDGLTDVLARHGVAPLPQLDPVTADDLRTFLSTADG